ncbi:MAG: hypothetical protein ABTQ31_03760 [Rhizobiaceae bacterium]
MRRTVLALLALASLASAATLVPAAAGDYRDRVYADSFGNLVVISRAGYKRIVVGAGELAAELQRYQRDGNAGAGADAGTGARGYEEPSAALRDCRAGPVFVKGRSYMYGLSEGEMPDLGNRCVD